MTDSVPHDPENIDFHSADYLENLIALMPGHVYWKDIKGVFLGCNNEQAKFIGLKSRYEIVGLTAYDTLPKDFADEITRVDQEVMRSGITKMTEEVLIFPDGTISTWLSKKIALYDKNNNVVGILGVSFDITEKKQIEQKRLEGMTLVSSTIAHELRTPLAAFGIATHSALKLFPHLKQAFLWAKENGAPLENINPNLLDFLEDALNSMHKEIRAAFTFIDMMLMKVNPSIEESKLEEFSIGECINESLSRYPFDLGQKELIIWEHTSDNDFLVRGDTLIMIHVFFNLIKNALFYVAKAGKGNIQIWLEKEHPYNSVFFKDTGTGISKENLPYIFDRFFSKTYHGAGVGLTFCKSVMESIGGTIKCESVEGNFTLFILSFPCII